MVTFSNEDEVIRVDVTSIFCNRSVFGGSHFFMCDISKITCFLGASLTGKKILAFRIIWLAKPPFHVGTLERISARQHPVDVGRYRLCITGLRI